MSELKVTPASEWSKPATAAPFSREDLEAVVKKAGEPRRICGIDCPHVVSPNARGATNCSNCGGFVFVGTEEELRAWFAGLK